MKFRKWWWYLRRKNRKWLKRVNAILNSKENREEIERQMYGTDISYCDGTKIEHIDPKDFFKT